MKNKNTINYTVKNNLCTGCGICEDICPTNSISISIKNKLWTPTINNITCINNRGCHQCFKVCAGHGIKIGEYSDKLWKKITL